MLKSTLLKEEEVCTLTLHHVSLVMPYPTTELEQTCPLELQYSRSGRNRQSLIQVSSSSTLHRTSSSLPITAFYTIQVMQNTPERNNSSHTYQLSSETCMDAAIVFGLFINEFNYTHTAIRERNLKESLGFT